MISKNQIKFIRSLEHKKNRRQEGLFVAEGPKVVGDLLEAGFTPHSIYCTAQQQASGLGGTPQKPAYGTAVTVSEDEMGRISFLQHPQGVLALFHMPAPDLRPPQPGTLALALDGIQDPGNLGTIIRIADWFGMKDIYCSPTTADAYSPKVVQATMGSLAHVNIQYCDLTRLLASCPCPVYGTLLDGDDIYRQPLSRDGIIVMGNEGNGISEAIRPLVTHRLLIPNFHDSAHTAESLNVAIATAITCSEFRRRDFF